MRDLHSCLRLTAGNTCFKVLNFLLPTDEELVNDTLIVSMRWSITNQFGQRILQIPFLSIQDSVLCPVQAYNVMCEMVAANPTDPLFSLPKRKSITYPAFHRLKYLISKIGLNPEASAVTRLDMEALLLPLKLMFQLFLLRRTETRKVTATKYTYHYLLKTNC